MATEAAQESQPTESSAPIESDSVIKTAEVIYKGKPHKFFLLENGVKLTCTVHLKTGGSTEKEVLNVPWRDVVSACEPPVKKTKASPPEAEAAPHQSKIFVLHYIEKASTKSNKLCCRNVQLELTDENSEGWIFSIEEKRKLGKPQKLLVVINPIGGKGNGRQLYMKQVHPLFATAGIETVVKMTERPKHAIEIGKTFDISTVDGVVVVGGDGLYAELLYAFIVRAQEEAGVDINDPEAKLVSPRVRIGIVPAGTGNGVAMALNGDVIDVTTATLNIIRGETNPTSVFSVHEPGKLIFYSGLLVANGYFSAIIKRTDELRWMKRARYAYVMITKTFAKKAVLDMDVEVLYKSPPQAAGDSEAAGESTDDAASTSGWTKLGTKHLTAATAFLAEMKDKGDDKFLYVPFCDCFDLFLLSAAGGLDNFKFLFGIFSRKKSALEQQFIERCRAVTGFRIRVLEEEKKDEAAGSRANSSHSELARMLDIDGELLTCSVPQFEVRMHPHLVQVFSVKPE